MANTPTTNIGLNKPAVGDTGWGVTTNATLDRLDLLLGKVATLAFGKTPLVVADFDGKVISITGELTANATMVLPVMDRPLFVMNNTTGAFTLGIKDNGSNTTITLVAGKLYLIWVKAATIVDIGALFQHNLFADVNTGDFRHLTAAQLSAVAYLNGAQSWTKQQSGTQYSLSSSSNHIATNCNNGNNFSHTMTENTTLDNPSNIVAGTYYTWTITQHASSAKTLALGNYFKSADGEAFGGMPTTTSSISTLFAYAETTTSLVYNWVTKGAS